MKKVKVTEVVHEETIIKETKVDNKAKEESKLTELVFILDRSGSMSGLVEDTIGGFNSLIEKNKKEEGECIVSTVLFDDEMEVLHDRTNIKDIKPLTNKEYFARGCTALVDAIGLGIHHIGNVHKYARKEDVPANTMFVIITDGLENASHIYTSDRVKAMIERQKEKYGWEFLFIGANIDAVETARRYGIDESRSVNYHADKMGTKVVYDNVCEASIKLRADACLNEDWKENIDKDYKQRKKGKITKINTQENIQVNTQVN